MIAIAAGKGFEAPTPSDFVFSPLFGKGTVLTKPMLIVIVGSILIAAFFYIAARRATVIPGKLQFAGEAVYGFVRNTIAGEAIGHGSRKFVPYLVTLFSFIFVLNISGVIPLVNFPATSKFAFPLFLAIISCVIFNVVGIRRQGFVAYFHDMMFPPGVPKLVYVLLAPIEFLSTVIIRPVTLTLRLQLNMFAGHLVLVLCILGGAYMFHASGILPYLSWVGFLAGIILTFFEAFIQFLQAYVFVLLSALYIGGALADEH
ncbi:MAG: F-type H+-transporting ATPase subunit a [Frankiales bacterium]|nr:F-type H+-transporting ATPase subunit a [Frankiales bacterium]